MVLLKTLLFTIVAPGAVTILVPFLLLPANPWPPLSSAGLIQLFGLIPMTIGATIYFRCAWDFTFTGKGTPAPIDPPKELVAKGLYQYVRNPMYVGVLLILLGEAWFFGSSSLLGYAAIVFVCFHLFVLLYEEPALKRRFGESYRRYCGTTPRWIPSPRGARGISNRADSRAR
jgi:protein-S-isoprenylcysteine O-methyltransferase Ste14